MALYFPSIGIVKELAVCQATGSRWPIEAINWPVLNSVVLLVVKAEKTKQRPAPAFLVLLGLGVAATVPAIGRVALVD